MPTIEELCEGLQPLQSHGVDSSTPGLPTSKIPDRFCMPDLI